jgi:hypothetical protein
MAGTANLWKWSVYSMVFDTENSNAKERGQEEAIDHCNPINAN